MAKLVIGTSKSVVVPAIVKEVEVKYALLSRVKDDSNNEIGTVCGYHTDANNQKYAVVCLDAAYRGLGFAWLSSTASVTGLTQYNVFGCVTNTDTATSNCDKIISYAQTQGLTSGAVSHCRSKSFVIDDTTYYGQLPTMSELFYVFANMTAINNKDTTASGNPDYVLKQTICWSSTQSTNTNQAWGMIFDAGSNGKIYKTNDISTYMTIPVLEIPMN